MNADFSSALEKMIADSGGRIYIVSGDRDNATQQRLWDEAVAKYGPDEARNWVAPPGSSYHEKGLAADLGGDIEWAQQHAAEYGLTFPMSWEPWHIEPSTARESGDKAGLTTPPPERETVAPATLTSPTHGGDPMAMLLNMLGLKSDILAGDITSSPGPSLTSSSTDLNTTSLTSPSTTTTSPDTAPSTSPSVLPPPSTSGRYTATGSSDIDRFMAAVREVESQGNYSATGSSTPWGTAKGAYQYLDSSWGGYGGYSSASDAPPEVQDRKAYEDMSNAFSRYGSWSNVAASWYAGPDQSRWQWQETQDYAAKVMTAMARQ